LGEKGVERLLGILAIYRTQSFIVSTWILLAPFSFFFPNFFPPLVGAEDGVV